MLKAIIHNDDFGLTHGFTDAILACSSHGITTSTSIRTNGTAFNYAINKFKAHKKSLGMGIHINLTDGLGHNGFLPHKNFLGYVLSSPQVEKELLAQFQIAIGDAKLSIDHINGHDHVHMIPKIFEVVAKIAREYGIIYIRLAREKFYSTGVLGQDIKPFFNGNILKFFVLNHFSKQNITTIKKYHLKTADCFYGILHTGHMDTSAIQAALTHALAHNYKLIEILSHPVIPSTRDKNYTSEYIRSYCLSKSRAVEYNALNDKHLFKFIKKHNIVLTNYKELL